MPIHNLLAEKLISVRYEDGSIDKLTLPGVLCKLSKEDIESFTALQPHQEQAWYCFLVQLAAMAIHESEAKTVEGDEAEWAGRLRTLTKGFPKDEPWCMVVEDLGKPAFMQTPVPEGSLKAYKSSFSIPDEIDTLIVAKDHDVKTLRVYKPSIGNWIFTLINLQTMQGFLGRGNYGIVRMNGGFANRPFLSFASSESLAFRYRRDTAILLDRHGALCEKYEFTKNAGNKLLWLQTWDGNAQLVLKNMDPYFIEICRRIRFEMGAKGIICRSANTEGYRIINENVNGITGDPWNVVNSEEAKSFSLASVGFTYKTIQTILFEASYLKPPCLEFQKKDSGDWLLIAKGLVRGQGITEGLHERKIPIPGKIRFMFDTVEGQSNLSKVSKQMITDAADFINKVFRMAVYALLQPDTEKFDFKDERPQKWSKRLDHEIDRMFFNRLWQFTEGDYEENRKAWLSDLKTFGENLLNQAFDSVPLSSIRKYKTISSAEGRFVGSFYNAFPFMKPQSTGGANG
jgi:CRISPR system Cascade subunit CasA